MRFPIITFGTHGDVRPYVALAQGFKRAGHEAFVVTDASFREFVEGNGVGFKPLNCDVRKMLEIIGGRDLAHRGNRPFSFFREVKRQVLPLTEELFRDTLAACEDMDAVLFGAIGGISASHIAEKLGVPAIGVSLQPYTPTRQIMSPLSPMFGKITMGGLFNRMSYEAVSAVSWQIFRKAVNNARASVLGLPPESGSHRIWDGKLAKMPMVYGFSEHVFPRPREWGDWVHIAGYWFLDDNSAPQDEVAEFVNRDGEVIYIGFGSMNIAEPERLFRSLSSVIKAEGIRAVISRGWGFAGDFESDENIHFCDYVPHDWLFPRMSAVVHHAGAGTTAGAIRAGTPSVAVPFVVDQFLWADRLYRLGLAPKPLSWKRFSHASFAKSISEVLSNSKYRETARHYQSLITAEDGIANAVNWMVERLTGGR
ncbi:MAG TPA: glycosyltransferase [candidate division Zixibacteria bacterium]|nr:glycosyltransferase [candidate division Zixibacteria bacterium]